MRTGHFLLALALALCFAASANGSYILSVESLSGGSSLTVWPGVSFNLYLELESDASDQITTARFNVVFSAPDLEYTAYIWSSPYVTGGGDDKSVPALSDLPVTITDTTYDGSADTVDIRMDSFPDEGTFSEGTLVQLTLAVPSDWTGGEVVTISTDSYYFANAVGEPGPVATDPGTDFTLNVVPEPGTLGFALLSFVFGGFYARRRKKTKP